jgi:hypothetical protein
MCTDVTLNMLCAGDHALTGLAIGKMLGIAGNNTVITGPEIDTMSDERLRTVSVITVLPGCFAEPVLGVSKHMTHGHMALLLCDEVCL